MRIRVWFATLFILFGCFAGVSHAAAPAAPSMSYSTSGLDLSINWTSVPGATGYVLYYVPAPYTGAESISSKEMGSATNFDISLWEGAAFLIAVQAYNQEGNSGYSNVGQFAVTTHVPPATPELFYDVDGASISITCDGVTNATGYILNYLTSAYTGKETFISKDLGASNSFSYNKLQDGQIYTIALQAYNEYGVSDYSNIETFTVGAPLELFIDSEMYQQTTVANSTMNVSGIVEGLALPTSVSWQVISAGNPSFGNFPIDAGGDWAGEVTLAAGENLIEISLHSSSSTKSFNVVYNPGYSFGGQLLVSPDVAYAGEQRTATAMISLIDPDSNPASVRLVKIDGELEVEIATLSDRGDLIVSGDEIEGDNIYTGTFIINEASEASISYRAVVGLVSGGNARSEVREVLISSHLTDAELTKTIENQNFYQEQLAATAPEDLPSTIADIKAELIADDSVAQVGESDSGNGLWVIYENGVAGVLYVPDSTSDVKSARSARSQTSTPAEGRSVEYIGHFTPQAAQPRVSLMSSMSAAAATSEIGNKVKSNKALVIAAQYFDWGENDDVPKMAKKLQDNSCFDVKYVKYNAAGVGNVEDFKNLGDYGVVLVSSHGDSFYNGILSLWQDRFKWNGWFGEVVLHSNMKVTTANKVTYEDDLKKGRLVLWGSNYGIMPTFIEKYAGKMPNSLIYMSICRGTWNSTLADAFLKKGAGAYLGYSDYVAVPFTVANGPPLMDKLLEAGKTLTDAFTAGIKETDKDPAEFLLYGAKDLSIEIDGLSDPSFENGQLTASWNVDGDARVITSLGTSVPTEGAKMAIISTGLGFTTSSGSLSQKYCQCASSTLISFDWNFFSEEYMEWVGSMFQDSFYVTMTEVDNPSNTVTLLYKTIDGLASEVSKVSNSFDMGDVYATGWRNANLAIPAALVGKKVELKFYVTDVGDSIYDSAVLIDNIMITGCTSE